MARGKVAMIENKYWVVDRLKEIQEDKQRLVSYHLLLRLEEKGWIAPVKRKVTPGRGKPRKFYEVTGKGRGLIALSTRWKKKTNDVELAEQIAVM